MSNLEKALQRAIQARNTKNSKPGQELAEVSEAGQLVQRNGHIGSMRENGLRDKAALEQQKIIFPDMSNSKVVDQFREIRTHIYKAIRENNSPILITSVTNDAGNTFVTKNIAAAIALDDAKTSLIVDCNLVNPGFKDLATEPDNLGVTDYIDSDIPLEEIISPVGISRMRMISAGARKESVTDYLTSNRLRALFIELQQRYSDRVILVDSPSINDSADAKILCSLFSHVILIVPYRKATESQVTNAIKAIGKEKIIGMVINREPQFLSLFKYKKQ